MLCEVRIFEEALEFLSTQNPLSLNFLIFLGGTITLLVIKTRDLQVVLKEVDYSKSTRNMLEGKHWNGSNVLYSCHVVSLLNMLQMLVINNVSALVYLYLSLVGLFGKMSALFTFTKCTVIIIIC